MKKYLKKSIMVVALMVFTLSGGLLLSACGSSLEMPSGNTNERVIEFNGGDVVTIGEYIYFANGYRSYSELKDGDNKTSNFAQLVRVKTSAGVIGYNEDGSLKNVEVVIDKIVGSDRTSMYVFGDYIYYTTPNIHKNSANENKFDYLTFFRVKLDGTCNEEIYTMTEYANASYSALSFNNKMYMVIFSGTKVNAFEMGNKLGKPQELAKEITNAVFPKTGEQFNGNIFITKDLTEEEKESGLTGNVVSYVNVETKEIKQLEKIDAYVFNLMMMENNDLIFSYTRNSVDQGVFRTDVSDVSKIELQSSTMIFSDAGATKFTSLKLNAAGNHMGYLVSYQSKLIKVPYNGLSFEIVLNENANILAYKSEFIYFAQSEKLCRKNIFGGEIQVVSDMTSMKLDKIDLDDSYAYFYAKRVIKELTEEEKEDGKEQEVDDKLYMHRVPLAYASNGSTKIYDFMGIIVK